MRKVDLEPGYYESVRITLLRYRKSSPSSPSLTSSRSSYWYMNAVCLRNSMVSISLNRFLTLCSLIAAFACRVKVCYPPRQFIILREIRTLITGKHTLFSKYSGSDTSSVAFVRARNDAVENASARVSRKEGTNS